MDKILVTTDLSANSRAGMRFAMQYASQHKAELIFLHIHYVLRATTWNDKTYEAYVQASEENLQKDLDSFVKSVYRSARIKPGKYSTVLINRYEIEDTIVKYAYANMCSYIIMSARGAGLFPRIFGTITSKVLATSHVPVIAVPQKYRIQPIKKIMFACDLYREQEELEKVIGFARPLKANVELTHFCYPFEHLEESKQKEQTIQERFKYPVSIHYDKREIEKTLLKDIEEAVDKTRPSLLVMFVKQRRSLFDKIFLPSKSAEYSFRTRVPLLVFNTKTA